MFRHVTFFWVPPFSPPESQSSPQWSQNLCPPCRINFYLPPAASYHTQVWKHCNIFYHFDLSQTVKIIFVPGISKMTANSNIMVLKYSVLLSPFSLFVWSSIKLPTMGPSSQCISLFTSVVGSEGFLSGRYVQRALVDFLSKGPGPLFPTYTQRFCNKNVLVCRYGPKLKRNQSMFS